MRAEVRPDLRRRALGNQQLQISPAGRFFAASADFSQRILEDLTPEDDDFLARQGILAPTALARHAQQLALARRHAPSSMLDYLILVPTLRCNLSCSYCQVSRVNPDKVGFDWSAEALLHVQRLVGSLTAPAIKIEFQGGEPTLRPDLIAAVIDACPPGTQASFVICSNLQALDDDVLALFDRPDVQISTSLDGDTGTHDRQRIGSAERTARFLANLDFLRERYGQGKISALPTIDPREPPAIETLIDAYASRGFTSIYLRPINYQGFARKRHAYSRDQDAAWRAYHERFIRTLILRNWHDRDQVLEETYFSLLLRRIFRPGEDRHVDLRNPNPVGRDYIVIDHDGRVYPTDEARMLSRSGIIDLAIGDIATGWDSEARAALDRASTNFGDPACDACAYQPFCGRDLVDDIARYGRVDLPRGDTEFCRRHLHLFDLAFSLIYAPDAPTQYSLRRWLGLAGDSVTLGASR